MPSQGGPSAGAAGPSREPGLQTKKDSRFVRRAVSPGNLSDTRRISSTSGHLTAASTLTSLTASRPALRDKFVPLPDANSKSQVVVEEVEDDEGAEAHESTLAPAVTQKRGRITVITVAETFNRKALEAALQHVAAVVSPTFVAAASTAPSPASTTNGTAPITGAGGGGSGSATGMTTGGGAASVNGTAPPGGGGGTGTGTSASGGATAVTMAVTAYPEVTYARTAHGEAVETPGEVFFFDYGVVAFWGMTEAQEQTLLTAVVKSRGVAVELLDEDERQVEELLFVYSRDSQPNIRNDTFTIDSRLAGDHQVKMAISHALAQSSKLAVYEERMVGLVEEVRHIPAEMAERGSISMSRRNVARLMGKVFLLKAAVNLTATMLDTPEFFWRAPDQLQSLYERACEYLDIQGRLDMLNTRFLVLQRMLDIWSDHSAHQNLARLDVIIVVLILIEVVMAGMEVVGFLMRRRGWEWHGPKLWELIWGHHHHHGQAQGLGLESGWAPGLQPGGTAGGGWM